MRVYWSFTCRNSWEPSIANTTVLVIVSVFVTLALVGMVMAVRYFCRGDDRPLDALTSPADEADAKIQAAQVDKDIEAIRARGRVKDASARASETALMRARLHDPTDRPA